MPTEIRWSVTSPWRRAGCTLLSRPCPRSGRGPSLAAFYNDSHNAAMMTHTQEASADEVVEMFHAMRDAGDRPFLLEQDGELMGDADFRGVQGVEAEFAILVGPRVQQSRGLGTRFAAMLHAAAVRVMGFERIYAT